MKREPFTVQGWIERVRELALSESLVDGAIELSRVELRGRALRSTELRSWPTDVSADEILSVACTDTTRAKRFERSYTLRVRRKDGSTALEESIRIDPKLAAEFAAEHRRVRAEPRSLEDELARQERLFAARERAFEGELGGLLGRMRAAEDSASRMRVDDARPIRLLMLDDEPAFHALLAEMAELFKGRVLVERALTLEEARSRARSEAFDRIVCDWHLGSNGTSEALVVELAREGREVLVAIEEARAAADPALARTLDRLGVRLLPKPVRLSDAIAGLRRWCPAP